MPASLGLDMQDSVKLRRSKAQHCNLHGVRRSCRGRRVHFSGGVGL